jgi:hypothetical protein
MALFQDLLLFGLDQIISDLVLQPQPPDKEPAATAWVWLNGSDGPQPPEVNAYIQSQFGSKSVSNASIDPTTKNWVAWSKGMQDAFPKAQGDVATWLGTLYTPPPPIMDLPTVPPEVINWTKASMPTNAVDVVVVKRGAASRAGS